MPNGRDCRGEPLIDRRRRLIGVDLCTRVHFSEHHVGEGPAFFRAAERHNLKGIVSKRADSRYIAGQTKAWLEIKSFTVGDFHVLGVERSSSGVPVALLATQGETPAYVGDAALTLNAKDRTLFWRDFERLGTPKARLAGLRLAKRKSESWVNEGLLARVRRLRGEETLRHASVKTIGRRDEMSGDLEARHPADE